MAFSTGPSGGGRRGYRTSGAFAEINIVPLVDVVLVLLIIFMLTAHVMEFGLEVDVPQVKQVRDGAEELPVVTVTKSGELYLNDQPVNYNALGAEVRKRFAGAKAVYVRADKETIWDPVAQVIDKLGTEKLDVRVVTKPLDEGGKSR